MLNINFTTTRKLGSIVLLLLLCFQTKAQHDVELQASIASYSQVGDTINYTLRAINNSSTDILALSVLVNIPTTLDIINILPASNTTFSTNTGQWHIQHELNQNTPFLELTLQARINAEGVHYLQAELSNMNGIDYNSTSLNGSFLENDIALSCVSVPIILNANETINLTAPSSISTGHEWMKVEGGNTTLVATSATISVSEAGTYRYTNNTTENCIPNTDCCDIILLPVCDMKVIHGGEIYYDNGTPADISDDTFTINLTVNGSEYGGTWTSEYGSGNYGETVTFGPFVVDEGAIFTIKDNLNGRCSISVGTNYSSCIYLGTCTCCTCCTAND